MEGNHYFNLLGVRIFVRHVLLKDSMVTISRMQPPHAQHPRTRHPRTFRLSYGHILLNAFFTSSSFSSVVDPSVSSNLDLASMVRRRQ